MIRFGFRLCPLDEVSPWGGDRPSLHWFGLTEGRYWLEVGGQPHPCVDYYLARLWEDVNVLTPDVLEAVPDDLQSFIATDSAQWACDPLDFIPEVDDGPDHPVVTAVNWHSGHHLDFGYLRNPPDLRLWRTVDGDRDEITLDWRHVDDGEIGFTQRCSVPTEAYVEAVHTLDRELMTAMHQRIQELRRRGGPPGVDLDLDTLQQEHQDRAQWLTRNLGRTPATDWAAVRQGARHLVGDIESTP
ncbi:DUF5984 family protein [Actinoplanes sp. CA-051413]|uniref:DUF5984 family protein n=1 Tax=Actinoplanes sp. CA-051413 TaxID=3239899 RepID=UPI003D991B04